jgi:hypothetical protein
LVGARLCTWDGAVCSCVRVYCFLSPRPPPPAGEEDAIEQDELQDPERTVSADIGQLDGCGVQQRTTAGAERRGSPDGHRGQEQASEAQSAERHDLPPDRQAPASGPHPPTVELEGGHGADRGGRQVGRHRPHPGNPDEQPQHGETRQRRDRRDRGVAQQLTPAYHQRPQTAKYWAVHGVIGHAPMVAGSPKRHL